MAKAVTAALPNRAPPFVGEIARVARTASDPAQRAMNEVTLRKAQVVEGALERARNSGRPEGEAIKAEFRAILGDKDARAGFSGEELRAMGRVVHGNLRRGLLEMAGQGLAPNQGAWLMHLVAGLGSGGATTPLAVAGHAAKHVAGRMPAADAARLSEMIRAGGSEAALAAARAPSPVTGQVLGTGAGLAVLGYPYP
jgi:hypothetical protein